MSVNPVLSDEANQECRDHIMSAGAIVHPNGGARVGLSTDLCNHTFFNLSRIPKKKKNK